MPYRFYGMSQDPRTKNYIVVLDLVCEKCNFVCDAIHFQRNFKNWTSGNNDIDKLIQNTQLSVHSSSDLVKVIEWIPYEQFINIGYIEEDEFGKVYRAYWIDGYVVNWNYMNQHWIRSQYIFVNLKSLNNLNNITLEFLKEVKLIYNKIFTFNLY
jgi:hypothetical protein